MKKHLKLIGTHIKENADEILAANHNGSENEDADDAMNIYPIEEMNRFATTAFKHYFTSQKLYSTSKEFSFAGLEGVHYLKEKSQSQKPPLDNIVQTTDMQTAGLCRAHCMTEAAFSDEPSQFGFEQLRSLFRGGEQERTSFKCEEFQFGSSIAGKKPSCSYAVTKLKEVIVSTSPISSEKKEEERVEGYAEHYPERFDKEFMDDEHYPEKNYPNEESFKNTNPKVDFLPRVIGQVYQLTEATTKGLFQALFGLQTPI